MPTTTVTTDPRDILSERLFDAPREKIFRAFEEPGRLARWWGPDGFTSTTHGFDFRPGGAWTFTFHGPDGKDYENRNVFDRIEKPGLIVVRHVSAPHFVMTITLDDAGAGRTRMHWRQRFESAQVREQVAPVCEPGNEQNFDRLQAELARMG